MAKKSLYQTLQVQSTAATEVIKAAYEARLAALSGSAAPEVAAERVILREAWELLADPVRRKLYDEKLREERMRALSSGGELEERPRPANARVAVASDEASRAPVGWMVGIGLLLAVGVLGSWVWLDHKRKVEAQRLQEQRQAEEARLKAEQAKAARETVDWAKDRVDESRYTAEQRREEAQRAADNRRIEYERARLSQQEQAEERRKQAELQRAELEQRRRDQESQRRAQMELERDRRHLRELERNRGMSIPAR